MPKVAVKIGTVPLREILDTSEYLAALKSRRSLSLQPEIEGKVTEIFVAAGAKVQAGAPIMQIDPSRQAALLSSEESSRAAKLASLQYLKQQAERMARLFEGGAVSQQERDQARMSYEAAQADVAALGAQVRQQAVQLHYYRVTAPVSGIVGDIPVRVGDRVTPQTRLTTLDNNELLEAYISVPAERGQELRLDQPVELLSSSGTLLADTTIRFIAPLISDDTQSILVKAVVENRQGQLRAGQIVRARVVFGRHKGPVIPFFSVIRLGGQYFTFVVEEAGGNLIARQRAVALGELSSKEFAVRAGIEPGARIVISGAQNLRDKSPIIEEK